MIRLMTTRQSDSTLGCIVHSTAHKLACTHTQKHWWKEVLTQTIRQSKLAGNLFPTVGQTRVVPIFDKGTCALQLSTA